MRILLTGATGYIGKRLLPVLLRQGHEVICCVRNRQSFEVEPEWDVQVFEVDFLYEVDTGSAPLDFDVAFFLIHSMSASIKNFESLEETAARNFRDYVEQSSARQIIYLTGMVSEEQKLSRHLESRFNVERILGDSNVPLTALRAGIIVGSGSASFEIMRDLVEKLPVMVAPRWVNTKCEPIAIRDVIQFLTGVMSREDCYNQDFDIGCGEVLTYEDMLRQYAEVRGLRRFIVVVPVMTPRLSSYWLYFVTSTTYELAVNLVDSMKIDVVSRDNRLTRMLGIEPITYRRAVELAFDCIEQNMVVSSWKDSLVSSSKLGSLKNYIKVPQYGCFQDRQSVPIRHNTPEQVWENIFSIGGDRGWYYADPLWRLRGFIDKIFGGIGLRRGRTHPDKINAGDALDFWRVLVADPEKRRLLLYAEMRLPGEAWLELSLRRAENETWLIQTATFRPFGLLGRIYWYSMFPFHYFIFRGMIHNIERYRPEGNVNLQGNA